MFSYYKIQFKLITEMLGTVTEASIYHKHVIEKAKKEIKKANALANKISKSLEKYKGVEISERKEILELHGVIRAYQAAIGKLSQPAPLPDTVEELLEFAKELREEFEELLAAGDSRQATVFLRDESGWPMLSTHMILGNIKENLRIIVNNGDKSIIDAKTRAEESCTLDIKAIDMFMRPSQDVIKDKDGKPVLCERSIRFENPQTFKETTAIALSEQLPIGTEFGTTLRIRSGSKFDSLENLKKIFELGKNNGFGAWRGSGNKGAYAFRLEKLKDFKETIFEGWN